MTLSLLQDIIALLVDVILPDLQDNGSAFRAVRSPQNFPSALPGSSYHSVVNMRASIAAKLLEWDKLGILIHGVDSDSLRRLLLTYMTQDFQNLSLLIKTMQLTTPNSQNSKLEAVVANFLKTNRIQPGESIEDWGLAALEYARRRMATPQPQQRWDFDLIANLASHVRANESSPKATQLLRAAILLMVEDLVKNGVEYQPTWDVQLILLQRAQEVGLVQSFSNLCAALITGKASFRLGPNLNHPTFLADPQNDALPNS